MQSVQRLFSFRTQIVTRANLLKMGLSCHFYPIELNMAAWVQLCNLNFCPWISKLFMPKGSVASKKAWNFISN